MCKKTPYFHRMLKTLWKTLKITRYVLKTKSRSIYWACKKHGFFYVKNRIYSEDNLSESLIKKVKKETWKSINKHKILILFYVACPKYSTRSLDAK